MPVAQKNAPATAATRSSHVSYETWARWYDRAVWYRRARLQLKLNPLCAMCLARGVVTRARHADHIEPHNGNWNSFARGAIQSLCLDCHNLKTWQHDRHGFLFAIGADGWPLDKAHPVYRRSCDTRRAFAVRSKAPKAVSGNRDLAY